MHGLPESAVTRAARVGGVPAVQTTATCGHTRAPGETPEAPRADGGSYAMGGRSRGANSMLLSSTSADALRSPKIIASVGSADGLERATRCP